MGFNGPVTSSVSVTVTGGSGSGTTSSTIVSIAIIPGAQAVAAPTQTGQFIAIGTNSSGGTVNLTGTSTWSSSSTQIATVGSLEKTGTVPGLATAVSQGTATITALYTNTSNGTVVVGVATFTVSSGGATSQSATSLTIIPGTESLSQQGQTGQYIALATFNTGLIQDVTNSPQLTWSTSPSSLASVSNYPTSPAGVVTGKSAGSVTVMAEYTNPAVGGNPANVVYATAAAMITTVAVPEPLLSLTIIPNDLTVLNLQGTGQFLAIGTYSVSPTVRDVTDSVTWISSFPNVFPVNTNTGGNTGASAGIVTAYGSGGATIIAEAKDIVTGSIQTATATFNCPLVLPCPTCTPPVAGSCFPGSQASELLSTVTVYNEGLNTTNWVVTAPSATGTANVIHCGPGWAGAGGSVCVATYPIGVPITLTAPAGAGKFGGWSSNCTPVPNPPTEAGPNQCILTPTTYNETVGAIFN